MVSPWKLTLAFFGLLFIYASEQKKHDVDLLLSVESSTHILLDI